MDAIFPRLAKPTFHYSKIHPQSQKINIDSRWNQMSDASWLRHSGEITLVRVAAGDRISPGLHHHHQQQRKGQQHARRLAISWRIFCSSRKKKRSLTVSPKTDGRKRYLSHVATLENKFKRFKVITLEEGFWFIMLMGGVRLKKMVDNVGRWCWCYYTAGQVNQSIWTVFRTF